VRTLPVLLVLAPTSPRGARLRELLQGDLTDDARLAEALTLLRAHPAMGAARQRLTAYVERGAGRGGRPAGGPVREALLALTDFVLARTG
jgi:heptaprenyl diphosphate synthase